MPKLLLLVVIFFIFSCSDNPAPTLRLGTNIWPGYEPLYLARDQKYLDEKRVRLVEYYSASQVIQAYRNGLIDAAALTLDEVLLLLEGEEELAVVLVMDISDGGDAIIGQSSIKKMQDLPGKRVGVENNALGAHVITRALEIEHIDIQSVQIIQLDISEQEKAFKQQKIDAVVTFEPVKSSLLKAGGNLLFDSKQLPGEIVDVLVVRLAYLKQHPKVVQYILDAWYQSLAYISSHPQESAKILGARSHQSIEETLAAYKGLQLPDHIQNQELLQTPEHKLRPTAERLLKLMKNNGLIKKQVNLDVLFTDTKLLHRGR